MIEIRVEGNDCDFKAEGTPLDMIAELCIAVEILINNICAGAPSHLDKKELKEVCVGSMIHALSKELTASEEGGITQ